MVWWLRWGLLAGCLIGGLGIFFTKSDHLYAQECGSERPFLGLGLGYNQYTVADVTGLADQDPCRLPLVYNWSPGESPQTAENWPHVDFPHRFIPMAYGCDTRRLKEQLALRPYAGPVLIFNEPDRRDQANCAPEEAARVLYELHQFRLDYAQMTGQELMYIVGGVGDSIEGLAWVEHFVVAYAQQFGVDPFEGGVAVGVHFHLYPRFAFDNGEQAFVNIQEQMSVWNAWLARRNLTAWVTELGVLNTPDQPMPADEYAIFLEKSISMLATEERIEHAFIFTLNALSGTESARFSRSALIIDGQKMPAYAVVKDACLVQGLCAAPGRESVMDGLSSPAIAPATPPMLSQSPAPVVLPAYSRPNGHSYAAGYRK